MAYQLQAETEHPDGSALLDRLVEQAFEGYMERRRKARTLVLLVVMFGLAIVYKVAA